MKRLIFLSLFFASAAYATSPEAYQLESSPLHGVNLLAYGADPTGATDTSAAFAAAFAAMPSGGVLHIPGLSAASGAVYKLTSNLTVPAGVKLDFDNAALNLGAKLLTVNGSIRAPMDLTIFLYSGSAVTGCAGVDAPVSFFGPQDSISAIWFGADPTNTIDSAPAIQQAVYSSCGSAYLGSNPRSAPEIFFPAGIYQIGESITNPLVMRGDDAILQANDAGVNILTNIGFFGKFNGLSFVGGNNAMSFNENGGSDPDGGLINGVTSNVWIQNDQFVNQAGAAINVDATCDNGFIVARDCWFESAATTSTVLTAASGTIEMHDSNASVAGTTVFNLTGQVVLFATDMSMAPGTSGGQWLQVTNAPGNVGSNVTFERIRFGGESSHKSVVNWNTSPANYWLNNGVLSSITVENSDIYSDFGAHTFAFYQLPARIRLTNNRGVNGDGVYFDPGIPLDQRQQIPSFIFSKAFDFDTSAPLSPASDVELGTRYGAAGYVARPATMTASDQVLAIAPADAGGYGYVASGTGPVAGSIANDIFNVPSEVITATDAGGAVSYLFSTALLSQDAGTPSIPPGSYSALFNFSACSSPMQGFFTAGAVGTSILIPEGESVISLPYYKAFSDPAPWAINTSYSAASRVLSSDGINIWSTTAGGMSAAAGAGPVGGSIGSTFADNTVTWEWIGSFAVGLQVNLPYNGNAATSPASFTFSRVRLVKHHPTVTTPNSIVIGTAPPTTGTWFQGDIVYNTVPTDGDGGVGYMGWICTIAGIPGTWKTFGAISP
jgi:hypothetical protein